MSTVVRVEHLTKDFLTGFWRPRPVRALDGLSFDVPAGGVFGLLGPNGAGKSTTLKLLLNLLRPTSGSVELLGRAPGDLGARGRLGFLPENPTFYDYLSAEELLRYFAGLFGHRGAEQRRLASRALDRVGLGSDRRRPIRQYSKGMVQRVGIAQAILNDPELVILDEPMSGLDPIGRRDIREMILELRDEGRTVLFSSHILADAELLCSRVGILARGKLVAAGAMGDLVAREAKGFEIVVARVDQSVIAAMEPRVRRVVAIADDRFSLEVAADVAPEPIVADLLARGATLVSVTPIRATLEDVFMKALHANDALGRAYATGADTRAEVPVS